MKTFIRPLFCAVAVFVFALTNQTPAQAQNRIEDRFANVNGVRLHYLIAGKGDPVILLHGYAQTNRMWRPLMEGGNSAGQAAVFLAQTARRVYMLVRSSGLAERMSRYLIRRIEESPAIDLRTNTELTALEGSDHLERVQWRNNQTGSVKTHSIGYVFAMTGAIPNAHWLDGCVALDAQGFIKTGSDLSPEELAAARWPLARPPFLLETSLPGVFAVGDVRGGNIKRVASAVGEGSIAVALVHQVLNE